MKFKAFFIGLLCYWFTGLFSPVAAIYDPLSVPNNRIGLHLLSPDEVEGAAKIINSSGGDWGYVTIPMRANDRNLETWEKFMIKCRELHIIPIIRLASFQISEKWDAPDEYSLIDFANFLDQLSWPTENRYVIIYNEPNHKNEWGGFVYPSEYARVLDRAVSIFHAKDPDFFVITGGMDSSAPDSFESLNTYAYFQEMDRAVPGIFKKVDGMSFHSYGNPAFSTRPNLSSKVNVNSFRFELDFLQKKFGATPKIFLTEAGWRRDLTGETRAVEFYQFALSSVWTRDVVAVTPFLYFAGEGPFKGFSFLDQDKKEYRFAQTYTNYPKTAGQPLVTSVLAAQPPAPEPQKEFQPYVIKSPMIKLFEQLMATFSRLK